MKIKQSLKANKSKIVKIAVVLAISLFVFSSLSVLNTDNGKINNSNINIKPDNSGISIGNWAGIYNASLSENAIGVNGELYYSNNLLYVLSRSDLYAFNSSNMQLLTENGISGTMMGVFNGTVYTYSYSINSPTTTITINEYNGISLFLSKTYSFSLNTPSYMNAPSINYPYDYSIAGVNSTSIYIYGPIFTFPTTVYATEMYLDYSVCYEIVSLPTMTGLWVYNILTNKFNNITINNLPSTGAMNYGVIDYSNSEIPVPINSEIAPIDQILSSGITYGAPIFYDIIQYYDFETGNTTNFASHVYIPASSFFCYYVDLANSSIHGIQMIQNNNNIINLITGLPQVSYALEDKPYAPLSNNNNITNPTPFLSQPISPTIYSTPLYQGAFYAVVGINNGYISIQITDLNSIPQVSSPSLTGFWYNVLYHGGSITVKDFNQYIGLFQNSIDRSNLYFSYYSNIEYSITFTQLSDIITLNNTIYMSGANNELYTVILSMPVKTTFKANGLVNNENATMILSRNLTFNISTSTTYSINLEPTIYNAQITAPSGFVLANVSVSNGGKLISANLFSQKSNISLKILNDPNITFNFVPTLYNVSFYHLNYAGIDYAVDIMHGTDPSYLVLNAQYLPKSDSNITNYTLQFSTMNNDLAFGLTNGTYTYKIVASTQYVIKPSSGNFTVKGKDINISFNVTSNYPSVVISKIPSSVYQGAIVQLSAINSSAGIGATITTYKWSITGPANSQYTKEIVNVKFSTIGTYTINLNIENSAGLSNSTSIGLTVLANYPIAKISSVPQYMPADTALIISGAGSSGGSNNAYITNYEWQISGPVKYFYNGSQYSQISVYFNTTGLYTISLTITNNYGNLNSNQTSITIVVFYINKNIQIALTQDAFTSTYAEYSINVIVPKDISISIVNFYIDKSVAVSITFDKLNTSLSNVNDYLYTATFNPAKFSISNHTLNVSAYDTVGGYNYVLLYKTFGSSSNTGSFNLINMFGGPTNFWAMISAIIGVIILVASIKVSRTSDVIIESGNGKESILKAKPVKESTTQRLQDFEKKRRLKKLNKKAKKGGNKQ